MVELSGKSGQDQRKARLARALRDNLKRRKAQARARDQANEGVAADEPDTAPGKPSTQR